MQFLEYMAVAYALIWAIVLGYFVSLAMKEKAIWGEIREIRRHLRDGEGVGIED